MTLGAGNDRRLTARHRLHRRTGRPDKQVAGGDIIRHIRSRADKHDSGKAEPFVHRRRTAAQNVDIGAVPDDDKNRFAVKKLHGADQRFGADRAFLFQPADMQNRLFPESPQRFPNGRTVSRGRKCIRVDSIDRGHDMRGIQRIVFNQIPPDILTDGKGIFSPVGKLL